MIRIDYINWHTGKRWELSFHPKFYFRSWRIDRFTISKLENIYLRFGKKVIIFTANKFY